MMDFSGCEEPFAAFLLFWGIISILGSVAMLNPWMTFNGILFLISAKAIYELGDKI